MHVLLSILILVAGLSPLLTFTRLFQIKEWRFDRLREHLRHEGRLRQLFGWTRPVVVGVGLVLFVVVDILLRRESYAIRQGSEPVELGAYVLWGTMGLLAWLTLFRFVVGKQTWPVWTKKAVTVTTLALFLLGGTAWALVPTGAPVGRPYIPHAIFTFFLPLFAFVFVMLSLFLLTPFDRLLKRRILKRAKKIRARGGNLTVVGITGSVGKTTTKELLAHILSDRNILVTPVHTNTELGVASLMIRQLKPDHQIFIVEMGAYRKGEIAALCALTQPSIGIITFIGRQHLGLFGSQEELCHAKGELFAALPPGGHAFLNADTLRLNSGRAEYCAHLMERASCPVHTVGTGLRPPLADFGRQAGGHAAFEAFDIQERHADRQAGAGGVSFTLRGTSFSVPIPGTHQVTNVLLAVAAAEALGVPLAESAKRLQSFRGLPQTFERKTGGRGQVVLDDTHNASPESFRACVEWARSEKAKERILVTSGLLELGREECAIHEELGSSARDVFDAVVFLSKKCVRSFELGYGKPVTVAPRKKFRVSPGEGTLIVCEGRMPESVVQGLLL